MHESELETFLAIGTEFKLSGLGEEEGVNIKMAEQGFSGQPLDNFVELDTQEVLIP